MVSRRYFRFLFITLAAICMLGACATTGPMGDEYFSIGMAYFDVGKFAQSEKWLLKAQGFPKNRHASLYNLGRIYFETKRYGESIQAFDELLELDPENILALKSAAFVRIKVGTGEALAQALSLYEKVVALVPDSTDSGYNYALVLFTLKEYGRAETVLMGLPETLQETGEALLLLARAQKAIGKAESIDSYEAWLDEWDEPKVMVEYAEACESAGFFARAVEAYDMVFESIESGSKGAAELNKDGALRFRKSRALMASGSEEGLVELDSAVSDGFKDAEQLENLLGDTRLPEKFRARIEEILTELEKETVD